MTNGDSATAAVRQMRRKLRRLFDRDPEAFARVVEDLLRHGTEWRKGLPPDDGKAVSRKTLALLLADYTMCREQSGVKYDAWLAEQARLGIRFGTTYSEGVWHTPQAVRKQLGIAKSLAKTDESFAAEVDAMKRTWKAIGGFRR